jgi:uncharacterized membrane protein
MDCISFPKKRKRQTTSKSGEKRTIWQISKQILIAYKKKSSLIVNLYLLLIQTLLGGQSKNGVKKLFTIRTAAIFI